MQNICGFNCLGKEKKQVPVFKEGKFFEGVYCIVCGRAYYKKNNCVISPLTTKDGEGIFFFSLYNTFVNRP